MNPQGTPAAVFPALTLLLAAATAYAIYRLFVSLRRDRFAADTPLAHIRSAAQGYVHIEGEAGPPPEGPIKAPLSGLPCVWWDYKIEHYTRGPGGGHSQWRVVDRAASVAPFSLRDADGECLVGPVGADVTPTSHETWYGDTPRPACLPDRARGWEPDRDYRYTERVISQGARLTVLGELRSRSMVESIEREVGRVVVEWKHDQAGLLARFDRNHDGSLDAGEWEAARTAAREQVEASIATRDARVSVVGQTTHGEPFVIAPLDGKSLVKREKQHAALALAASVILALLTAWAAQKVALR